MPEQIPYGVAASIIERLASAAFREFGRIYHVMDELEMLKSTMESIKAVLLDAEERQEQDLAVQIWIRRLKEVLHPADDLLDEIVIQDMRHKADSGPKQVFHFSSPNQIAFHRKTARKIEKIRKKFNDVVQEMSQLNLSPRAVVVKQIGSVRRETSSFVLESDIIGREDNKMEIINLLRQSHKSQNVSLVAIVGIGGLGKTALAQLVYNDVEVQNLFEKRMWVCVSDNFDVKVILKNMLESLANKKIDDKLSLDTLQNKLRENLTGKRYLLVLDDIWNESLEKWDQLRTYLMCGAQGSKVLVTTRSKNVARTMGVSDPFVLNGLTSKESWSLLKKITFGDATRRVNQTLESTGKKIAKKCRGVPLAIRTLGGLLQSKSEEIEWIGVLQGDFWKSSEDEDSIMPVLKRSYQNLSSQQRQCFAYCSLYPKDLKIEKDELIQLWMAQGYLDCSTEKQTMEDVGNQFVKTFLMKSFFQDAEMTEHGDIVSFKMHDLMHDLAMLVAGNDCCYLDNISEANKLEGRPMHVWLKSSAIGLLRSLDASKLRTLILTHYNGGENSVITKFKYLRVLKLSSSALIKFPGSIGRLTHLRYLHLLRCNCLTRLPKSISNLVCLQTFKLEVCYYLQFSTKVVSKLINLRHLEINHWKTSGDKMTIGMGKLSVRCYEGNFVKVLRVIHLNFLSSFTNIVEISLGQCSSTQSFPPPSCRYLPPLESLPFLKSLKISSFKELEYIYLEENFLVTFFPSLETLSFQYCRKLRGWCRMGDDFNDANSSSHHLLLPSFPRLSQLLIHNCPRLTCMPTFPSLDKRLELCDCNVEPLEATLKTVVSKCSVDFTPLSMLKSLRIGGSLDVKKFPENWMQNLTSLEHLVFLYFSSQTFHDIEFWFKDDFKSLPSLQKITVQFCIDLKALPDWICNFSSLQHVTMSYCKDLASLPEEMPRLTKLQTLKIIGCPLLIRECQIEASAARPKIAHIPNIILKHSPFRRMGRLIV
ncbi:Virus X resistance protein-like, coiled-coil domain [Sesbania bispinosa]|nr:Virus X resistance protein-like, coiled-coil domain [Sesbania bispinosa]